MQVAWRVSSDLTASPAGMSVRSGRPFIKSHSSAWVQAGATASTEESVRLAEKLIDLIPGSLYTDEGTAFRLAPLGFPAAAVRGPS
jgi:hypothetical protein